MNSALLAMLLLHPYHVSVSEVGWNEQSNRFEVAMRLDPRDLTRAVSLHAKKSIHLERTSEKELAEVITHYVRTKFVASSSEESKARWHWVGMENEPRYVWVYMELEPPAGSRRLEISNRLLMEVAPTQENTMVFLGEKKQSFRFHRKSPTRTFVRHADRWIEAVQ